MQHSECNDIRFSGEKTQQFSVRRGGENSTVEAMAELFER